MNYPIHRTFFGGVDETEGHSSMDMEWTEVVDLAVTERLVPRVPDGVVLVAESGILTADDVSRLESAGADAFLGG